MLLRSLALLVFPCTSALHAKVLKTNFCGVDLTSPPSGMFAHGDAQHSWKKFVKNADLPTLELGEGQFAKIWRNSQGNLVVSLDEPAEDFGRFTTYCFDHANRLIAVQFELRSAWGWAYEEASTIRNGKCLISSSEYFSTKTDKPLAKKPDSADDIKDALKPDLYLSIDRLPFYSLLRLK